MGHYWSEMRGPETELERKQRRATRLVEKLRRLKGSEFTVDQLALLLRSGWSEYKENYYDGECDTIISLAKKKGIKDGE